ncbi:MAG: redoxin domain-containing protein [Myxococcales bacterium]|nr:redoxin domain-containing protein [Myxococcales bacterium]
MPNVGDIGPNFALSNQDDQIIILDRVTGRHAAVVVCFLPQAGAPGCTKEALGFRDLMAEFTARNIAVVAITPSAQTDVAQFAREHKLNFSVVSDPTRRSCDEWGALRGDTTARTTYVVSSKGVITHHFPRVDVFKHAGEVLALFGAAPVASPSSVAAPAASPAPAAASSAADPAPAVAVSIPSSTADLIVQAARATLSLLLAHQQSGGSIPPDVQALCSRLGNPTARS